MGRRLSVGVVVVAVAVVGACGDPDISNSSPASLGSASGEDSAPPATRALPTLSELRDSVTVTAVDAGDVNEPCPTDASVDMNATGASVVLDEASRLEPMIGAVLQYGSQHPGVFGGYGLHWITAGDASVFVSFTGDLGEHRAALTELVEYPDELIVCQAPASETDRSAIQATLSSELNGRYTEISSGGKSGAVVVGLNPTEQTLADELVRRYGTAIDVRVGALTYPLDDADSVCAPRLEPSLIDGLDAAVLDTTEPVTMTRTGTVPLTIRLTNTSDQPIRFDSGQPSMVITDQQGSPRTSDTRGVPLAGIEVALQPDAHQDFEVEVLLASCDPALGYLVPPGNHHVVVSVYNVQLQTNMHSQPLPITIAD